MVEPWGHAAARLQAGGARTTRVMGQLDAEDWQLRLDPPEVQAPSMAAAHADVVGPPVPACDRTAPGLPGTNPQRPGHRLRALRHSVGPRPPAPHSWEKRSTHVQQQHPRASGRLVLTGSWSGLVLPAHPTRPLARMDLLRLVLDRLHPYCSEGPGRHDHPLCASPPSHSDRRLEQRLA